LHFLPLPLAGWAPGHARELAGGIAGWAFGLAYTSAINQAFDDRLDRAFKNPVGAAFDRRRAIALSIPPALACIVVLAAFSPAGLVPGVVMLLAATVYSAPPRLKQFPVVGTLWNLVMGVPGCFFAGPPPLDELRLLVGLFALLLLGSQLLHEAQDRDDDAAGQVRTVATEAGRRAALAGALIIVLLTPGVAWWLASGVARRTYIAAACAGFAVLQLALVGANLRSDDLPALQRLRMRYRWSAIVLGAVVFVASAA
jgi:4-hydroxybenzoate polyprenyltransferase